MTIAREETDCLHVAAVNGRWGLLRHVGGFLEHTNKAAVNEKRAVDVFLRICKCTKLIRN